MGVFCKVQFLRDRSLSVFDSINIIEYVAWTHMNAIPPIIDDFRIVHT